MEHRSHRLLLLFAATTVGPAIALGWLGWRLVEQDRALEKQRVQERREHAADLAAAGLERKIGELESALGDGKKLPAGAAILTLDRNGVVDRAGVRLPFLPVDQGSGPEAFRRAEELEFGGAGAEALAVLEELARSRDRATQGGAWLRIARVERKRGDADKALQALAALARLENTLVEGVAAGLLAAQGRGLLLEAAGRKAELRETAERLDGELREGRWLVSRSAFAFAREQVRGWLGGGDSRVDADLVAMAEAAESVWKEWPAATGRRTFWSGDRAVLVTTKAVGDRVMVGLAGERFLRADWPAPPDVALALTDSEGRTVLGDAKAPVTQQAVRTASTTRLPWTVHAVSLRDVDSGRSPLLMAAVVMMAVLILGSGYLAYRAVSRELHVAKLQSDFVAAVSHEFRTPLTTIRQMSEMLVQDRVSSVERRRQFYEVLLRESDRLHRLVDGLLNFGRMEAGQMRYRFEVVDPAVVVRDVVADFRQEAGKAGYAVELEESGSVAPIRADRESLARVFWNLLENAVKYSPECHTVWVELGVAGKQVEVRVKDRGIGIPAGEQREIFRKFVRGARPKESAIQGTGVGLAIARQIVEAHRGEIQVRSAPGEGSEFTVLLPLAE
ncbi:MAG: HAMP domain-containing sensor histidine kinase [Bryobacteraceae bacterium]